MHRGSTLFIVGAEDPVAPPEVVALAAAMMPNARCEIAPNAGHSAYLEQPEVFNSRIREAVVRKSGTLGISGVTR